MLSTVWWDYMNTTARDNVGEGGARDSLRAILLLVLFILTFAAAMLATVLKGEWARSHITSLLSCVGAGVFLATCLLDLLPEALESFEKADLNLEFPLAEFSVALGFLMVLTMEQVVLAIQRRNSSNRMPLHNDDDVDEHSHAHDSHALHETDTLSNVMLVSALSLHALFEGLSLAVITEVPKLLEVFGALILHKTIIGFCLGVRLVQNGIRNHWLALCAFIFSVQVLIGGLCGISILNLIGDKKSLTALVSCILQGIACGTFLFITMFEVLPEELGKPGSRMNRLFALYAGFGIVVGHIVLFPE